MLQADPKPDCSDGGGWKKKACFTYVHTKTTKVEDGASAAEKSNLQFERFQITSQLIGTNTFSSKQSTIGNRKILVITKKMMPFFHLIYNMTGIKPETRKKNIFQKLYLL